MIKLVLFNDTLRDSREDVCVCFSLNCKKDEIYAVGYAEGVSITSGDK